MAINYFTCQGYTVSLPMNDTQWYDLVIEKDGIFQTVQCKSTQTKNGIIDFRSTGGTAGKVYDNLLNHSELDYLFCVDGNLDMWLIPVKELTTKRQISCARSQQLIVKVFKLINIEFKSRIQHHKSVAFEHCWFKSNLAHHMETTEWLVR